MSALTTAQLPQASACRSAPSPFLCTTRPGGTEAAWIQVVGELDLLTAPQLERALHDAQLDNRVVVLDLREVSFIDSAGVHILLAAHKDAQRGSTQLRVVPNRIVDRMLRISGATGQMPTVNLGETSIAALSVPSG